MSVSSVSSSTSAYAYLQSLLPPAGGSNADAVSKLFGVFYPNGGSDQSTPAASGGAAAPATLPPPSSCGPEFSPETMASLISIQGQGGNGAVAARAQSLFGAFDANGDGQISKSEFENVFGANADMSKVDGLFSTLDTSGDGSVSQDELTSAAQQSHAHHHHHHMHGAASGGGLASLLSGLTGASSQTGSSTDGSTSTTITYGDGSTITMTTPAAAASAGAQTNGQSGGNAGNNLLEQLIRLQAQFLTPSASQTLATV
jgi:hypothetical protein